jgi:CheY-like chemotaxis protein
MNLVVNARDAIAGAGRIFIETSNLGAGSSHSQPDNCPYGWVKLAVTDTGPGISDEIKPHLFEPFFTTKEKGKGTGLGLATVYGIVKQNGGDIHVESQPGKGARFEILMPRVDAIGEMAADPDPGAEVLGGEETIMVVEDDEAVRNLVISILSMHGYNVLHAPDALEASTQTDRGVPTIDLLLTDMMMRYMNGRDLAEQFLKSNPHMKVLFMSGYSDEALLPNGFESNDTEFGFLCKPFGPDVLLKKVREVLDRKN